MKAFTLILTLLTAMLPCYVPARAFAPSVTFANAMLKIHPNDVAGFETVAEIAAAQNEFEAFQVVIIGPASGVSVTPPTLIGPGGAAIPAGEVRLYREAYLNITTPSNLEGGTGPWPDALIPDIDEIANEKRNAFPFDVPAGENRVIWVEVHVPQDQTPGNYNGSLTVTGSGLGTVNVPVKLLVWDFALPSTSSLASTFGMGSITSCVAHFGTYEACGYDAGVERMHLMYARYMLDHRITAELVYYGPTNCSGTNCDWSHFDAIYGPLIDGTDPNLHLKGAHLTSIRYNWIKSSVNYAAWAQHFRAKNWFDRTFDYTCDEPPNGCAWSEINPRASMIHSADPEFRTLVTTTIDEANAHGVTGSINILSPPVNFFDDKAGFPYAGNQRLKYAPFLQSNQRNLLWWYQACMSHGCFVIGDNYFSGWPSLMVDNTSMQNRSQGMLSWLYDVSGVLYYATDLHLSTAWNSVYDFGGNGDGTLLYPGKPSIIGGKTDIPIAGIRMKMIREGFEDYEYLKLVSDLGDPGFARQIGQALFPNVYSSVQPPASLYAAREALARRILELKGSPQSSNTPSLSSISPNNGTQGSTVNVTLTGTNLSGATLNVSNTGVTVSNVNATSANQITATFTIAATATTGPANVTATTSSGTSGSQIFTINPLETTPGQLSVISALALSPSPTVISQPTTSTFTVKNIGQQSISLQYIFTAVRDQFGANLDYPVSAPITLEPGQQFIYTAKRSFTKAGTYSAWPAYYDYNGNWIELGPHIHFEVGAQSSGSPSITTSTIANGIQNTAYKATLSATGGTPPYTWAITSGSLPTGLTLGSSTGVISGTPTVTGTSNFTVQVTDANFQTGTKTLTITINPAPPPITWTRVEETNSAVVLTGNWPTISFDFFSGGSAVEANVAGARATFYFNGTAARWVGLKDRWSGIAKVYVDGVFKGQVDTYAPSDKEEQVLMYSISGLTSGNHSLTVEVTGLKNSSSAQVWVWVDAFEYASSSPPPPPITWTRVEETNSAVILTGNWPTISFPFFSGGSAVEANVAGARATFNFNGTGARWIGLRDRWSGIAKVYVDGVLKGQVDTYAPSDKEEQVLMYTITGLTLGNHSLTVEVTGQKNSSSAQAAVWVDAFEYTR
jgi:hypothetical protein